MKFVGIIAIVVVCSFSLILPNAYAEDFTIDSRCEAGNLILTIVNEEGVVIQNVKVRTTDGLRYTSKIHDTFYSNESGEVSIDFSKNTGYVYVVKGGFNDQRFENENCDPDKIPVWIKTNAQWWIEDKIDENSFLEGMRYLIKENIIVIPKNIDDDRNSVTYETGQKIPVWVKTTIEWWAGNVIDDETFLQGIQFLVTNKIIDLSENRIITLSENKIIEQSVIRIDIQDVLPSRTVFTKTVLGITPEFGSIPGGHTYAVASGDNVSCGSEGVRARYFMIDESGYVKYQTHVCSFVNSEQVKAQLTQDMEKTKQGSGIWSSSSTVVTMESQEIGECYFAESKKILGIYCGIDEYLISSTVEGSPLDKAILISIQQKTIEKFQELRQDPLDFSLLELIESGTPFVDSSNVYSSGITSTQSSNVQTQNDAAECSPDFPYRWDDGNCWNLPQNYETQIQLECPSGYPYVWSDGNCYNVPECTGDYPYRGSDGQCYNMPECTNDFPYRWDDNQCYNLPQDYEEYLGCPSDYPYERSDGNCYQCPTKSSYLWSDGNCYNLQECIYPYSYRWDDGQCYNQPPQLACVNNNNYDTGYGYCCPDDMYTTGDGMCRFIQACPAGYWETNYGDCCPNGTFDPGDGSCRYP